MYYNLFDSHSHSENSPDGDHSVTFIAETAIARGLQGLAITDHLEGDHFTRECFDKRICQSAVDTAIAKAAFGDRLILTLGVEVAQVFYDQAAVEKTLACARFDFVLGSLHRLVYDGFDFYCEDFSDLSADRLHNYLEKYFEELLDLIEWGGFDVLAHLSFPLRCLKLNAGIDVGLERYAEAIDEVLARLARNGKGLEINTSGLRCDLNDTLPPAWVVRRFRELGGEIVTIGSDAHRVEDLGAGIGHGMKLLAEAGYERFAFYRGRKPVMLRII